jgi:hypothetical protein
MSYSFLSGVASELQVYQVCVSVSSVKRDLIHSQKRPIHGQKRPTLHWHTWATTSIRFGLYAPIKNTLRKCVQCQKRPNTQPKETLYTAKRDLLYIDYTSVRFGLYSPIKKLLIGETTSPAEVPLWKKILAGGLAGGLGSAIANPTDLVKIRMQVANVFIYIYIL